MPRRPRLPDDVRASDPAAREILSEVQATCAALRAGDALQAQRLARRNDLFAVAREQGVSWADLGRVAEIAPETILTIVKNATAAVG